MADGVGVMARQVRRARSPTVGSYIIAYGRAAARINQPNRWCAARAEDVCTFEAVSAATSSTGMNYGRNALRNILTGAPQCTKMYHRRGVVRGRTGDMEKLETKTLRRTVWEVPGQFQQLRKWCISVRFGANGFERPDSTHRFPGPLSRLNVPAARSPAAFGRVQAPFER